MSIKQMRIYFAFVLIICISLTGCKGLLGKATITPERTATMTITKTTTKIPKKTETLKPTATFTNTPASTLAFSPGANYEVNAGGFSFYLPETMDGDDDFRVEIDGEAVLITNETETMRVVVFSETFQDYEGLENEFEVMQDSIGEVNYYSDPVPFKFGNYPGLRVDYEQNINERHIRGELIIVELGDSRILGVFSFSSGGNPLEKWRVEGKPFLEMLLSSIKIYDPILFDPLSVCEISTDPSYGYEETNPIKVGGSFFDGPSRERFYLDNLRGPNGESITYTRGGSVDMENTILDIYYVEYAGLTEPIVLYIDMYSWEPPKAPVGFTCAGLFPLEAP